MSAQTNRTELRSGKIEEASSLDSEWMSYRTAYMQMIRFEKYSKPKHLIQSHFQIVPKDSHTSIEGVRLTLLDSSSSLNLPLDATGRAVFPFLKSAYDNNARLVLDRKQNLYSLQARVSITPRSDGIYEAADLQAACEQVLQYLRYIGKPSIQDKKCIGIRFSYPRNVVEPIVKFRIHDLQTPLAAGEGSAFQDTAAITYKTVDYLFSDWPDKGQIVTQSMSAAIAPIFQPQQ